MTDNPRKIVGVFSTLLFVWVLAYWLWPDSRAAVKLDQRPASVPVIFDQPTPLTRLDREPARAETPPAEPISTAAPIRVIEKPRFREYTVQRGDTSFEAIAARPEVFGNRRLASAIAAANPMVSPNKLIAGKTVLKIPLDPTNIQGREVTITPPASTPATPASPPKPAATPEVYVVQSGDTLSGIAKTVYGKSALWETILDANADVLTDPAKLRPGMKLRIPRNPAD